ncbi:MAG: PilZ domain-containing protein [Lachnospiraceae bacterium]|nr:PilZ domain-containing protein [Lachnospiraceae bacterium]
MANLADLSAGASIRVAVYGKNHTGIFFETTVVAQSMRDREILRANTKEDVVLVSLIHTEDGSNIVNFESELVRCEVLVPSSGEFYNDIRVRRVFLPDAGDVHVVMCPISEHFINRRAYFRLWVGVQGTASTTGLTDFAQETVTIRDVSAGGVGFFCRRGFPADVGDTLIVTFADYSSKKSFWFSLNCVVVRAVGADRGDKILGCRLLREHEEVHDYVHKKQLDRIRRLSLEPGQQMDEFDEEDE